MQDEVFVPIHGFPRYEISNHGRVRNVETMQCLKGKIQTDGYLQVCLRNENCHSWMLIHRLVAVHFIPNPDNLPVVDHANCDKKDNYIGNLRWCSKQENNWNRGSVPGSSSIYKGVHWDHLYGKWKAQIHLDGKTSCLGFFDDEEDAGLAYDLAAECEHGQFARLNLL